MEENEEKANDFPHAEYYTAYCEPGNAGGKDASLKFGPSQPIKPTMGYSLL
jgi:hypothetical protein